jgi:hypothetical protein
MDVERKKRAERKGEEWSTIYRPNAGGKLACFYGMQMPWLPPFKKCNVPERTLQI